MNVLLLPVVALCILIVAGVVVAVRRRGFNAHLDALESEISRPRQPQGRRSDLPLEVVALATRMGARVNDATGVVNFEQSGQMWATPDSKPMAFTARQTVGVDTPEFLWRATTGLPASVRIADYLVAGTGGLEAKALGAFSLVQTVGGADAYQGEALRYLAELPWNPDAILVNRALDWTVFDPKMIKVGVGIGEQRAEVTFELDASGLIVRARAASRLYSNKEGRPTRYPWRGKFWDYQPLGDRFMPRQGEVAWVFKSGEFTYWRGRLRSWSNTAEPGSVTSFNSRPPH